MPKTKKTTTTNQKKTAPSKKTKTKAVKVQEPTTKVSAKNQDKEETRIRIKIRAYDHRLIDESARKIIDNTLRQGAEVCGPVPLPTEIHKWTVNRSTFVHKDARDQYEMRIYKRVIDIINPNAKIIDSLSRLDLPAGVDVEIKY